MKFYRVAVKIISPVIKFILNVKVINDNSDFPPQGKYIICANHLSNWDALVILASTKLPISFMAKNVLFKIPVLNLIMKLAGAIPVKRNGIDKNAIKKSLETIDNGGYFSVFPQGKRIRTTPDESQVKGGMGLICHHAKAGVLPIGIYTKNYKMGLFKRTVVHIGKLIQYNELDFGESGEDNLLCTKKVFREICELAKEKQI